MKNKSSNVLVIGILTFGLGIGSLVWMAHLTDWKVSLAMLLFMLSHFIGYHFVTFR